MSLISNLHVGFVMPDEVFLSSLRESSSVKDSNANLHKALFTPGGLPDGTEVSYYVKGQVCGYFQYIYGFLIENLLQHQVDICVQLR